MNPTAFLINTHSDCLFTISLKRGKLCQWEYNWMLLLLLLLLIVISMMYREL